MGGCVVGDIVLAPVPYTDLSGGKTRPALVVADVRMGDWVVCAMTGRDQARPGDIAVTSQDLQRGSLRGDGWVRVGRLYTLNHTLFRRTIGALTDAKRDEVLAAVRALF